MQNVPPIAGHYNTSLQITSIPKYSRAKHLSIAYLSIISSNDQQPVHSTITISKSAIALPHRGKYKFASTSVVYCFDHRPHTSHHKMAMFSRGFRYLKTTWTQLDPQTRMFYRYRTLTLANLGFTLGTGIAIMEKLDEVKNALKGIEDAKTRKENGDGTVARSKWGFGW